MAALAIGLAGLALSAKSAVDQRKQGKAMESNMQQQAQAQREQADFERRKADIQNSRQLRQAVRQARMARATIVNSGANAGTSFSTGVSGGVASVESQLNANKGYFNAMRSADEGIRGTQITQANLYAQQGSIQARAATAGALGTIGNTIFANAGGFETIFGKKMPGSSAATKAS